MPTFEVLQILKVAAAANSYISISVHTNDQHVHIIPAAWCIVFHIFYLTDEKILVALWTIKDILFAACNWGMYDPSGWIRSHGAHSYRSTGDILVDPKLHDVSRSS